MCLLQKELPLKKKLQSHIAQYHDEDHFVLQYLVCLSKKQTLVEHLFEVPGLHSTKQ